MVKYPEYAEACQAIGPALKRVRLAAHNTQHVELEGRLGFWSEDGHFVNGVTETFFNDSIKDLKQHAGWLSETPDFVPIHDVLYTHNGRNIRTSVAYHPGQTDIAHITKTQTSKFELVRPHSGFAFRVSIALEETVQESDVPDVTISPTFFRIKHRKTFVSTSKDSKKKAPHWAIDFTRVWEGQTQKEAEQKQKTEKPRYEVEVEALNVAEYATLTKSHSDVATVLSLLFKLRGFDPAGGGTYRLMKRY